MNGTLTHFDTFTGIGGFALAARWAGYDTLAFCEIDDYCRRVIAKHWPGVHCVKDIHDVTEELIRQLGLYGATVLTGGFPCQPYSLAGDQLGADDDRALWPELLRVIGLVRPSWFIGENVPGFIGLALDDALSDLEAAAYETLAFVLPALCVGASHLRNRVIIVAHARSGGGEAGGNAAGRQARADSGQRGPRSAVANAEGIDGRPGLRDNGSAQFGRCLAGDNDDRSRDCHGRLFVAESSKTDLCQSGGRTSGHSQSGMGGSLDGLSAWLDGFDWPALRGLEQYAWEPTRTNAPGSVPNREERLKGCGNAVVPQIVYPFFKWIAEYERIEGAQP